MTPRWIATVFDGAGLYWVGGRESEGGHWAERWWAPSRLWRQKWCYLGQHWWMVSGSGGGHDYWREGYWWQHPKDTGHRLPNDAVRWCARCPARRGSVRYPRPSDVSLSWCPGCGMVDKFVGEHGHLRRCAGDNRGSA